MRIEYERITAFVRRWSDVLSEFGMHKVLEKPGLSGRLYGGGESPANKRLKEHIRVNPHLARAGPDWQAAALRPRRSRACLMPPMMIMRWEFTRW